MELLRKLAYVPGYDCAYDCFKIYNHSRKEAILSGYAVAHLVMGILCTLPFISIVAAIFFRNIPLFMQKKDLEIAGLKEKIQKIEQDNKTAIQKIVNDVKNGKKIEDIHGSSKTPETNQDTTHTSVENKIKKYLDTHLLGHYTKQDKEVFFKNAIEKLEIFGNQLIKHIKIKIIADKADYSYCYYSSVSFEPKSMDLVVLYLKEKFNFTINVKEDSHINRSESFGWEGFIGEKCCSIKREDYKYYKMDILFGPSNFHIFPDNN